mmetsp:Transcript_44258/g.99577  ORF Transcript_44258/g.99577 Transcript_44258/m.99577 type:complete len:299 (+) Transcript_44258:49-945(+)
MSPRLWRAVSTAFVEPDAQEDGGVSPRCDPEGEMLWKKGPDNADIYQLCFAPQRLSGQYGPGGAKLTCDKGSQFQMEAPRFCCSHPRITLDGKVMRPQEGVDVCGDTVAEFDPKAQQIQLVGGPASTGSQKDHEDLLTTPTPQEVPSPVGRLFYKETKEVQPLANFTCNGRLGTLIKWKNSGRVEMCPTGTKPVHGKDWKSWNCDGDYLLDDKYFCCRVHGKLHCTQKFRDQTKASRCTCPSTSRFHSPEEDSRIAARLPAEATHSGVPPMLAIHLVWMAALAAEAHHMRAVKVESFL